MLPNISYVKEEIKTTKTETLENITDDQRQKVTRGSPEATQRSDWSGLPAKLGERKQAHLGFREKAQVLCGGARAHDRAAQPASQTREHRDARVHAVGLRRANVHREQLES